MENLNRGIDVYKSYTYGNWGEINKALLILQFIIFCILPIIIGITLLIVSRKGTNKYLKAFSILLIMVGIVLPIFSVYHTGKRSIDKEAQQQAQLESEALIKKQKDEIISNQFMNNGKEYYVLPDSFTNNKIVHNVSLRNYDPESYFEDELSSVYVDSKGNTSIILDDSLITNKSYRQVRCSEAVNIPCREISSILGTMTCTDWPDRLDCKLDMENGRQLWFKVYNSNININEQELLNSIVRKSSREIKLFSI
jgi:hypothetical protein